MKPKFTVSKGFKAMKKIIGIILRAIWVFSWELIQAPLLLLLPIMVIICAVLTLIADGNLKDFKVQMINTGSLMIDHINYKVHWIIYGD